MSRREATTLCDTQQHLQHKRDTRTETTGGCSSQGGLDNQHPHTTSCAQADLLLCRLLVLLYSRQQLVQRVCPRTWDDRLPQLLVGRVQRQRQAHTRHVGCHRPDARDDADSRHSDVLLAQRKHACVVVAITAAAAAAVKRKPASTQYDMETQEGRRSTLQGNAPGL